MLLIEGRLQGSVAIMSWQTQHALEWISLLAHRAFSGGLRSDRSLYGLSLFKKEHTNTSCSSTDHGGSCFENIPVERTIKHPEQPTEHGPMNPRT